MILTRTPLRISLIGGGTDMPSFYEAHTSMVISTAINKYIHVLVNPKFDGRFRVSYSKTENVDSVSEIQHDIVREAIKLFQVKGLEVVSVSDIPGEGSGLGSSSAFTVGLLLALYAYCKYPTSSKGLAEHAFALEGQICGHPIGKQDPWAAAFGSFYCHVFKQSGCLRNNMNLTDEDLKVIGSNLMLFWTGLRSGNVSRDILHDQMLRLGHGHAAEESGLLMAELAKNMMDDLEQKNFRRIGKFVKASWALKKRFAEGITNQWIDQLVGNALNAGAEGVKICGAGGGGFMLVVADPTVQKAVCDAVGLRQVPIKIGVRGSCVVYSEE